MSTEGFSYFWDRLREQDSKDPTPERVKELDKAESAVALAKFLLEGIVVTTRKKAEETDSNLISFVSTLESKLGDEYSQIVSSLEQRLSQTDDPDVQAQLQSQLAEMQKRQESLGKMQQEISGILDKADQLFGFIDGRLTRKSSSQES